MPDSDTNNSDDQTDSIEISRRTATIAREELSRTIERTGGRESDEDANTPLAEVQRRLSMAGPPEAKVTIRLVEEIITDVADERGVDATDVDPLVDATFNAERELRRELSGGLGESDAGPGGVACDGGTRTIEVSPETHERLKFQQTEGESLDDVVARHLSGLPGRDEWTCKNCGEEICAPEEHHETHDIVIWQLLVEGADYCRPDAFCSERCFREHMNRLLGGASSDGSQPMSDGGVGAQPASGRSVPLTDSDRAVLGYLQRTDMALPPKVLHHNLLADTDADYSKRTIKRRLPLLRRRGLVARVDERAGYYRITDTGRERLHDEYDGLADASKVSVLSSAEGYPGTSVADGGDQ